MPTVLTDRPPRPARGVSDPRHEGPRHGALVRPLGAWLIAFASVLQFVLFARAMLADWSHLTVAAGTQALSTLRLVGAFLPSTLLLVAGLCFLGARRTAVVLFGLYLAWGLWWLGTLSPGIQDGLRLALAAIGVVYGLVLVREDRVAPVMTAATPADDAPDRRR